MNVGQVKEKRKGKSPMHSRTKVRKLYTNEDYRKNWL